MDREQKVSLFAIMHLHIKQINFLFPVHSFLILCVCVCVCEFENQVSVN